MKASPFIYPLLLLLLGFFFFFNTNIAFANHLPGQEGDTCTLKSSGIVGYCGGGGSICGPKNYLNQFCTGTGNAQTGNNCCVAVLGADYCEGTSFFGVRGGPGDCTNVNYLWECCTQATPTPTPTPYPCIAGGGSCIPSFPCNPGYTPSSLSCGDSGVCCVAAPTPTLAPTCDSGSYTTCAAAQDIGSWSTIGNMCGAKQYYKITVPTGSTCKIEWWLKALTSDFDLYADWNSTTCLTGTDGWDCVSNNSGTGDDYCTAPNLPAGTYYAMTNRYVSGGKYNIEGKRTCTPLPTSTPTSTPTPTPLPRLTSCVGGAGETLASGVNEGVYPEYYGICKPNDGSFCAGYANNVACGPSSVYTCPAGNTIKVFIDYDIGPQASCNFDSVKFLKSDGTELAKLCGNSGGYVWKGPYSSNTIKFQFNSDDTFAYTGFDIWKIECVAPGATPTPTPGGATATPVPTATSTPPPGATATPTRTPTPTPPPSCVLTCNGVCWSQAWIDNANCPCGASCVGGTSTAFKCDICPTPTPTTGPAPTPTPIGGLKKCKMHIWKDDACSVPGGIAVSGTFFGIPMNDYYTECRNDLPPENTCQDAPDEGTSKAYDLFDCVVCSPTPIPDPPTPTPVYTTPFYYISGSIFIDDNKNKLKDSGENNYTGTPKSKMEFRIGGGLTPCQSGDLVKTVEQVSNGDYGTPQDLNSGTYAVCFTNPPTSEGYTMTFPINLPPFFVVTVGSSCDASSGNPIKSPPSPLAATCTDGNITKLNFGISNSFPWIQSVGRDMRIDSGYSQKIPKLKDASLPNNQGSPGIIFSGNSTPSFGEGKSSTQGWVVGTPSDKNLYTSSHHFVTTSYEYQLSNAKDYGLAPTSLTDAHCGTGGIENCTLSNLPHDLYLADGNLNLNSYTFTSNQNYVILVNGDLHILGNIKVDTGSTVTFSVKGDIYIDKDVGETDASSTTSNLDGFYSTDKRFIVEGINNCPTQDKRLNIGGTVITNASLTNGSTNKLENLRDLCGQNKNYPTIQFQERLDLILNAPLLIQNITKTYREVPPK